MREPPHRVGLAVALVRPAHPSSDGFRGLSNRLDERWNIGPEEGAQEIGAGVEDRHGFHHSSGAIFTDTSSRALGKEVRVLPHHGRS
jgi:hypothetical protein